MAAGRAGNDAGEDRAVLWSGSGWQQKTDLGTLKSDNTGRSWVNALSAAMLARLGSGSMALLDGQAAALARAAAGCRAGAGEFCYAVQYRHEAGGGVGEGAAGFSLGYGFSPRWSAALTLDQPARRSLPDFHRSTGLSPGVGLNARWQHESGWFAAASAAANRYTAEITRPAFEEGGSLEAYLGLRHRRISRAAYAEEGTLAFPARYGRMALTDTAAVLGVRGEVPLGVRWSWVGMLEAEQRLGGSAAAYTAEAPYIGSFRQAADANSLRGYLGSGLRYRITPQMGLSLMPHIGRGLTDGSRKGASLRLEGRF